jgi:flagellar biosynthetic protein FliR
VNIPIDLNWIEAVMLASVRFTTFVFIAPPFSYNAIPAQIKVMLSIGLAIAVSPRITQSYHSLDTAGFLGALVLEILVGAVLGFLVMVVFSAMQSAGNLIDMFGGFQLAQAFDPQAMVNGAQFTRLFQMVTIALMFTSGAYQLVLGGLTRSFTALPIGGGLDLSSPASAMIKATTQMFLASVQIAGPLIVVLFLADAGLGLLTRVAPALQAFAMGFPLKILLTLTLVVVVFVAIPQIVESLTSQAVDLMIGAS